jgi:hypothetical protein
MGGSDDSQIQIPKTTILPEFKGSEEEKSTFQDRALGQTSQRPGQSPSFFAQ